jgi:hypothetical protein
MIIILNEKGFLGVFTVHASCCWLRFVQIHSILIFPNLKNVSVKSILVFGLSFSLLMRFVPNDNNYVQLRLQYFVNSFRAVNKWLVKIRSFIFSILFANFRNYPKVCY